MLRKWEAKLERWERGAIFQKDQYAVWSLTSFFNVPKGDEAICMVYNGTSSGLNDAVWVPWFPLPIVETHLHAVDFGTYIMADNNMGEMFLNFMLDENLRAYTRVDISTKLFPDEVDTNGFLWEW